MLNIRYRVTWSAKDSAGTLSPSRLKTFIALGINENVNLFPHI